MIEAGLSKTIPVAIIHWGTLANQKTIVGNLDTIVSRLDEISNPSIIVIGEVVQLHEKINWFKEQCETSETYL